MLLAQIRGMHTIIRDATTSKNDFVFMADRLTRLVVEAGLGHLPFTDKTVITPTGGLGLGWAYCICRRAAHTQASCCGCCALLAVVCGDTCAICPWVWHEAPATLAGLLQGTVQLAGSLLLTLLLGLLLLLLAAPCGPDARRAPLCRC